MFPPLERDPRYRSLDIWRGVACLMVVIHHSGFAILPDPVGSEGWESWFRWGIRSLIWRLNLGVPLFFVISGYCIAASVDATRRRGSSSWFFLGRRLWRIYPPYWASLLWFVGLGWALPVLGYGQLLGPPYPFALELFRPETLNPAQWFGNLTLTETWRPLVSGGPVFLFTRVSWSLCYEEQFYLVCFLVLLLTPRRMYAALGVVTVLVLLVRVVAADVGMLYRIAGTFPILWHEFAIGLAVYCRLNVPMSDRSKRALELSLVGLLLVGLFSGGGTTVVEYSTAASAAFGLILIAVRDWDDWSERQSWLQPLRACGRRCYSIYLFHLPVCTMGIVLLYEQGLTGYWTRLFVVVPVVSMAAVAVSWVFYHHVERHFLNPPIVRREPKAPPSPSEPPLAGEEPELVAVADSDRGP